MAASCLEQRCAPLGNSFLECPELRVRSSRDKLLRKSWGLYKVEASRMRRHHSIGGFIPYAYTRLPLPDLSCWSERAVKKHHGSGPRFSASWSDSEESGSQCASGDRGYASENSTEPSTPMDQDTYAPSRSCSSRKCKVSDEPGLDGPKLDQKHHMPGPSLWSDSEESGSHYTSGDKGYASENSTQPSTSQDPKHNLEPAKVAVTTMMIRNLPHNSSQSMLLEELDRTGFAELYDFVYMPTAFDAKQSKGYAFINFVSEAAATSFGEIWHKSRHCGVRATLLTISPAALQGLDANIKKLAGPRMARIRNPALRPFVREKSGLPIHSGTSALACRADRRSTRGQKFAL